MRRTSTSLFLAACLALGTSSFAQETAETPTEAPVEQGGELAAGEPVGPQVGQAYVFETHGDWAQRCIKAPEGEPERCDLYQLLTDGNGAAVAEFTLTRLPEGAREVAGQSLVAGITVVAPLETLLTQQLTLSVDSGEARRYPFAFCNAGGCVARIGFTQPEVDAFKRGAAAKVRLVPAAAPDENVVLNVSLSGFTNGYNALSPR